MNYVDMSEMLKKALKNNYAVPAFNIYNLETAQAVLNVCSKLNKDVILAVSESAAKYAGGFHVLCNIVNSLKTNSNINIALHLDHGSCFEACKNAIDAGFSSVMIDASNLPFDKNIEVTRQVVEYAKKQTRKISVEAELGELVGVEDDKFGNEQVFTSPEKAKEFVEKTNIDCLAVSIGTSHGINKGVGIPKIRFDIVEQIQNLLPNTPLVCHGASMVRQEIVSSINNVGGKLKQAQGIDTTDIHNLAINTNICKINMDTDLRLAFTLGTRSHMQSKPEDYDPRKYLSTAKQEMEKQVEFAIKLLN